MSRTTPRRALLAGAAALAALGGTAATAATATAAPRPAELPAPGAGTSAALAPPLEFAYFRTWHDSASDPSRPNSMIELPPEIDVAFVFPAYTPPESPFWTALRDEYVPALHAQGTRVVETVGIEAVLDTAFPDTAAGHRANAEHLVTTIVEAHGVDGLDVDMESTLTSAQTARAAGVFRELATFLGPLSGTGRLFVYDTNRDGTVPLFRSTADCFDYVLVQSYGRSLSTLQGTWDTFAPSIDPSQYLIGFSFYEENDPFGWDDTSEPFEGSRAAAYADWQPAGATKGGIFSYAVDRDGVAYKDNTVRHTTYEWSKALKHRMLGDG